MERLARQITGFVYQTGTDFQYEVIYYGIRRFLETTVAVAVSVAIGIILKSAGEVILFLSGVYYIRSAVGGYHCPKYYQCFFLSNIIVFLNVFLMKYVQPDDIISIFLLIGSSFLLWRLGLRECQSKGLTAAGSSYFLKKLRRRLVFLVMICFILLIVHQGKLISIMAMSVLTSQISLLTAFLDPKGSRRGVAIALKNEGVV